ncbi:MAG: carboxypeptidase-like regulatory domain-containing protein, partial [Dysgonamonadaceae bacterium]|nr:carboxypeptidase-like regulatory domain-containing protein [Dysgonamonadaceae bacterium]
MPKYYFLFALIFSSFSIFAQTEIKGVITGNENGKALSGISVTVQEKGSSGMLGYSITDEKGNYKLNFKSTSDSVKINFSGFNIKKESGMLRNHSQEFNFHLSSQDINLKEVKITPPKIRQIGDTLNYHVDGYKDENDRTIGDVLKKMPGIEVKESGAILVNNKPINKLYIENMDLLQGRYGIATNNIRANDVSTVQVLENHQPIKALKDKIWSDEAAINLKLKDSAKGTLIANGMLGAGVNPFLWNNELFSMFFTKGKQHVSTYKGNNTGDDVSRDLGSFYSSDANRLSDRSWMSVQSPATPSISQKRYLFNRAN